MFILYFFLRSKSLFHKNRMCSLNHGTVFSFKITFPFLTIFSFLICFCDQYHVLLLLIFFVAATSSLSLNVETAACPLGPSSCPLGPSSATDKCSSGFFSSLERKQEKQAAINLNCLFSTKAEWDLWVQEKHLKNLFNNLSWRTKLLTIIIKQFWFV